MTAGAVAARFVVVLPVSKLARLSPPAGGHPCAPPLDEGGFLVAHFALVAAISLSRRSVSSLSCSVMPVLTRCVRFCPLAPIIWASEVVPPAAPG